MNKVLGIAVLVALSIGPVFAQTWTIDPVHSRVEFAVTYMMLGEVTGRFTEFSVTLVQGKEDFSGSTITATIKTASITTDNETRDKHLRSDDFFNAEKFPEFKFVSTSFEKTGEKSFAIKGNLTIRDVTKEVTMDAKFLGTTIDPRGNTRVGFQASTTINRQDYGVKWNKPLDAGGVVTGNEVTITLRTQFLKQK